jgi:hypothetical protein
MREIIRVLTMSLIAVAAFASLARASPGDGRGAGPVFAFSTDGTFSLGWELSALARLPLFKGSIGGSYALNAPPQEASVIHYIAYEPWFIVGGTLGASLMDFNRVSFLYGIWEGAPIPLTGKLIVDSGTPHEPTTWVLTLTVGGRVFGGKSQFYFAPKLWRYNTLVWDG